MQRLNPKEHGRSKDLVTENISKIRELFPEAFIEGKFGRKVDFDILRQILGEENIESDSEHYRFTWNGKSQARMLAQMPTTGTLRPCRKESIDWDTTQNLFIEGDNLEVLKLLQKSYHNKVKMIYIDPPYNTGKDFIYPDDFHDNLKNYLQRTGQLDGKGQRQSTNAETNGRYHTDWLNMMYPRLMLARNLLRDDGVIFISIDNHEVTNLKKICDEIFGEENFVEEIAWKNKYGSGALTKGFASVHEYILVYSKGVLSNIAAPLNEEQRRTYKNRDSKFNIRGGYITQPLATTSKDDRPNLRYAITHEGIDIWPDKQWIWSQERLKEAYANDEIVINEQGGQYSVRLKQYLKDESGVERLGKPTSLLNGPFNQEGTQELKALFEAPIFDFPKPSCLIKYFFSCIVNNANEDDGIYLDFFSGSCSAAHALMSLNLERGGNRRFIMVQLPEPCDEKSEAYKAGYSNIAEIGKERIRLVVKKLKNENPEYQGDLGFKVFKLDSTNIKLWQAAYDNIELTLQDFVNNTKDGRTEEDLLYEILLKYGLDLSLPIEERTIGGAKVSIIGMGALVVCLAKSISKATVEGIAKLKDDLGPETEMRVVFKDSGFRGHKGDVDKTNAMQILKRRGIKDIKSL